MGGIPKSAVFQGDIFTWSTELTPRSDPRSFEIDLVKMRKHKDKSKLNYVESEGGNLYGLPLGYWKYSVRKVRFQSISKGKENRDHIDFESAIND